MMLGPVAPESAPAPLLTAVRLSRGESKSCSPVLAACKRPPLGIFILLAVCADKFEFCEGLALKPPTGGSASTFGATGGVAGAAP